MAGKKSELSLMKWPRNQLLNDVATLWQRLDNVRQRRHNIVDQRRHNFHFRSRHNVVTTSTTMLWQRCHNVAVPAGPLYGDFVFQVIIKNSRYFIYVSKVLCNECHSQNIALIYLIANVWRNRRSEIFLIEKVFAWTVKCLFSPCSILDIHDYFLEVMGFCII